MIDYNDRTVRLHILGNDFEGELKRSGDITTNLRTGFLTIREIEIIPNKKIVTEMSDCNDRTVRLHILGDDFEGELLNSKGIITNLETGIMTIGEIEIIPNKKYNTHYSLF